MSEVFISEGCWIDELYSDADTSLARARVEPGVRTALHALTVTERYLIERGSGTMTLGDREFSVGPGDRVAIPAGTPQRIHNTGDGDLVFLCLCTPRFTPACYAELAPPDRG